MCSAYSFGMLQLRQSPSSTTVGTHTRNIVTRLPPFESGCFLQRMQGLEEHPHSSSSFYASD